MSWPFHTRLTALAFITMGLLRCTHPVMTRPHVVEPPTRSDTIESASPSEFYVVVQGLDGDSKERSALQLGDVEGATFLSDPPLLYRDGAFVSLGMGEAFGLSGRWPDDVWALANPECQADGRIDTPECGYGVDVVLWKKGRWAKVGFLELDVTAFSRTRVNAWTRQRAVTFSERVPVTNENTPGDGVRNVDVFGTEPLPPLRTRSTHGYRVTSVRVVGPDEALVLGEATDAKPFVERWVGDGREESVSFPVGARVFATDWKHMLVVETSGKASMFDGATSAPVELPLLSSVVLSYARERSGREWLITADSATNWQNEPLESRLFVRTKEIAWTRVALPLPAYPGVSNDNRIKPTDVHVAGEGDVWLRGWTAGNCHGRGVVLHNQRPKAVCFLERNGRACQDRPKGREDERGDCGAILGD